MAHLQVGGHGVDLDAVAAFGVGVGVGVGHHGLHMDGWSDAEPRSCVRAGRMGGLPRWNWRLPEWLPLLLLPESWEMDMDIVTRMLYILLLPGLRVVKSGAEGADPFFTFFSFSLYFMYSKNACAMGRKGRSDIGINPVR